MIKELIIFEVNDMQLVYQMTALGKNISPRDISGSREP